MSASVEYAVVYRDDRPAEKLAADVNVETAKVLVAGHKGAAKLLVSRDGGEWKEVSISDNEARGL